MQNVTHIILNTLLFTILLFSSCKQDNVVQAKSKSAELTTARIESNAIEEIEEVEAVATSQSSEALKRKGEEEATLKKVVSEKEPAKKALSQKKSTQKKPAVKKSKQKKLRPIITFDEPLQDFGTIMEGDTVDFKFTFTNTGKAPLDISSAVPTCGCTLPSFPFIPVEPGEKGYVGVKYISIGKEGNQNPSIEVTSNGSAQPVVLTMKGFVEPKPKEETVEIDSTEMASDSIRD